MIPVLLILLPLLTGIISFFIKEENAAKGWGLLPAVLTLIVAVAGIYFYPTAQLSFDSAWLPSLGSRFTMSMDGMSKMLV